MVESMKKKFQSFIKNVDAQMGGVGTMYAVFFAAIIVLAIVIVFTFVPGIGSTVSQSVPSAPAYCGNTTNATTCAASLKGGGEWNISDTNNPNQAALSGASGVSVWTSASGMLKVALIIGVVVIILGSLFAIFQHRRQGGGGGAGEGL